MTFSAFRQADTDTREPAHERTVRGHYAQPGLRDTILRGLAALKQSGDDTLVETLAAVDEFHVGGHDATLALARQLALGSESDVLDVGCGLGGTARTLAARYGCHVVGIDLVPELVSIGTMLNELAGLSACVRLQVDRATDIHLSNCSFDRCTLLHVGMNVPDKRSLMEEIHRVLKPGGVLGLYEVMRVGDANLTFPLPWASTADASFVADPGEYRDALESAGLDIIAVRNRSNFGLRYFQTLQHTVAKNGAAALGLHLAMGADAVPKIRHTIQALESEAVAPVEVIARRRP